MTTPIVDFVEKYDEKISLRLHMPGHKGKCFISPVAAVHSLDITEVCGADSLYEANGIIKESEENAAKLFGAYKTIYSTGGSTLGIQTMVSSAVPVGAKIIAARNAHRAFVNTCALLDLDVVWVTGENADVISSNVTAKDIENALCKEKDACAVYITTPDYYGRMCDVKTISEICKKHNVPLLVDNAHGAHLAFMKENLHPISLGADICCDSAHKTLPVLTGGAYIHTASEKYAEKIKEKQSVFGSSSPSYLTLCSLDYCNFFLENSIREALSETEKKMSALKERLSPAWQFVEGDILHLTVESYKSGLSGYDLADRLRERGIECEYADDLYTVMLFSPIDNDEDFEKLCTAMENIPQPRILLYKDEIPFVLPEKAMFIRAATFAENEKIPVEKAEGRICSLNAVHCPPCVPVVVAGEKIDKNSINILKKYGIFEINVVK